MTETNVITSFSCQAEFHTRAEFQAAGHFVPGHVTGPTVMVLMLMHPKAKVGPLGGQVLRVLGNTLDECIGLMSTAIHEELFIQWQANQMTSFDRTQFLHLNERMNQLAQYMAYHYPLHSGITPEVAAMDYLDKSRNNGLLARVGRWFKPAKSQGQATKSEEAQHGK